MPRKLRINLITALSLSILGMLLAFVVAPIVALVFIHKAPQGGISPEEYVAFTENIQHLNLVISILTIGGIGLATVSAIYSFVIFAIWFIGPPENKS